MQLSAPVSPTEPGHGRALTRPDFSRFTLARARPVFSGLPFRKALAPVRLFGPAFSRGPSPTFRALSKKNRAKARRFSAWLATEESHCRALHTINYLWKSPFDGRGSWRGGGGGDSATSASDRAGPWTGFGSAGTVFCRFG